MADISNPTSNTTLYDELGNQVGVTLNSVTGKYELNVRIDEEIKTSLASPHQYQEIGRFFALPYSGNLANKLENDILLIRNSAANTYDWESWDWSLGTVGNITIIWRMYEAPTITANGTAQTPVNTNTSSTNTSTMNVYTLPTVTARGTKVDEAVVTIGTLRVRHDFGFALHPGSDYLITLQASAANNDFSLVTKWAEDED